MTSPTAEKLYQAQHNHAMSGKRWVVHNPHDKPLNELPVIYGLNNGGSEGWYDAQLLSEDGASLGSHICSHEIYMQHDLGILEGTRPDRHETFRKHYPDGYRMEFVSYDDAKTHDGLQLAISKHLNSSEGKS